jgi:hypothetical protein
MVDSVATDFGGIASITISLDGVMVKNCNAPAVGAHCTATVSWQVGTGAHLVSTTAVSKNGLHQTASVRYVG